MAVDLGENDLRSESSSGGSVICISLFRHRTTDKRLSVSEATSRRTQDDGIGHHMKDVSMVRSWLSSDEETALRKQ